MCRFVAYLGQAILLSDVLIKPVNSLVCQSLQARESDVPTNGDGFGLGWYAPEISDEPAVFTSIFPAWSNRNLVSLSKKIKSPAFLAHVRAASEGGVSSANCHPFTYKKWLFMHNGGIDGFIKIKRHLRHQLDDDIYNWIKGETDSEHFFALFLQRAKGRNLNTLTVVADVLEETITEVLSLMQRYHVKGDAYFNVVIADGMRMLASRFCSNKKLIPASLHYAVGSRLIQRAVEHPADRLLGTKGGQQCMLIASEKLNEMEAEWHEIRPNQLILVDTGIQISTRELRVAD